MRAVAALALAVLLGPAMPAGAEDMPVDLELILAVDVSQSVDPVEGRLQRLGYVAALRDPKVIQAIDGGATGRITVSYLEWAGPGLWLETVGWTLLDTPADASRLADILERRPVARGVGTSLTSVIGQAARMFDGNGFIGERRVIDISGDGPNGSGGPVTAARDAAVAAGIVVNGVAINNNDGSLFSLPDLDVYYRECVIGGPGSFVLPAEGFESFADAILRKLILEIADIPPPPGRVHAGLPVVLVQGGPDIPAPDAGALPRYAPACDIGERMRMRDNPGRP